MVLDSKEKRWGLLLMPLPLPLGGPDSLDRSWKMPPLGGMMWFADTRIVSIRTAAAASVNQDWKVAFDLSLHRFNQTKTLPACKLGEFVFCNSKG